MEKNEQLELAHQFVKNTNTTIFLTGKAGTGKTTFLRQLKEELPKRMVVVAPTGVAAINAGGVTIHSFFQLSFGPLLPGQILNGNKSSGSSARKYRKEKIDLIKSLDLLVIDEISMVRADLLDGIDEVLRKFKNRSLPFGGTQLLMIGDLQQLPPVVRNEDWNLLRNHYETPFFFGSKAFQKSEHISIELQHVYRQKDQDFINILNEIRNNKVSDKSYRELQKRYIPNFNPGNDESYITLTTHNDRARKINDEKLEQLNGKSEKFTAIIDGQFPEYSFPTNEELVLKEGAQVMFVKNDSSPEQNFFNGKIGTVVGFQEGIILVKSDDSIIEVLPEIWHNIKYNLNEENKEIEENIVGQFSQYPLKLAWAITIHKSQGLTFDKAVIDANAAFAHGQVYVALSRCKSLDGLILKSQLNKNGIICDHSVSKFTQYIENHPPTQEQLGLSEMNFKFQLLEELFGFIGINRVLLNMNKHLQDNLSIITGDLESLIKQAEQTFQSEIVNVAEKFIPVLKKYCFNDIILEENNEAQTRIKKAAIYFTEKLNNHVVATLNKHSFDTDNKSIKKLILDYLNQLNELTSIKLICLKNCALGFHFENYLNVRAKAHLTKPKLKQKKESVDEKVEHPALLIQLKQWRRKISDKEDIPAYYIASQKSLIDIANYLPYTTDQLKVVKGFGKKKIEKYGAEIIQMITEYRQEKGLGMLNFSPEPVEKPKKQDTKEISLELYQEGKNIREIAAFRNLTVQTIERHLAHYIGLGMLDLKDFMEQDKIETIKSEFQRTGLESLNPVKEALGDNYSWTELRFVQAFLKNAK